MFHKDGRVGIFSTVAVVLLVGCSTNSNSIRIPISQLPTSTPPNDTTPYRDPLPTYVNYVPPFDVVGYTHFAPSEKSKIHLEFDYPTSWVFCEQVYEFGDSTIFLQDPRFLDVPTPSPDDYHPAPTDLGSIFISIIPSKPGRTVESETEDEKQRYREVGWATFLKDYKVAIDGFGARVIEHQIQVPEIHTSEMFERSIYFFAQNEIYRIVFEVAEKERGGKFEQGYEYFFNSLKIMP